MSGKRTYEAMRESGPRSSYRALRAKLRKPWKAAGMKRSTWYCHRKRETDDATARGQRLD